MQTTTAVFDRRIRQSGKRKTVVDLYFNNQVLAEDIPVSEGNVRMDRKAAIRRSGSITIPDRSLVPAFNSNLNPYGTEVRIRQGIVYPNGDEELIPVGVFILDTTSWEEAQGPVPSIEIFDRSMVMGRAQVGATADFSGMTPKEVIEHLMGYFWPELSVTFDEANLTMASNLPNPGGTTYTSGNAWDAVQDMARKLGGEIYFDTEGLPVVNKIPVLNEDITSLDAVWTVDTGETGILRTAKRSITRKDVYNSVYVTGAATEGGVVPTAHVVNTNPNSPTDRNGPFRKMGIRISDNSLTTDEMCTQLALQKLAEYTKLAKTLDFTCIGNPAVEPGDIVLVKFLDDSQELGLIETIGLPLAGGQYSVGCSVARV